MNEKGKLRDSGKYNDWNEDCGMKIKLKSFLEKLRKEKNERER